MAKASKWGDATINYKVAMKYVFYRKTTPQLIGYSFVQHAIIQLDIVHH